MIIKEVTEPITIYCADDGTEFTTEEDCKDYEFYEQVKSEYGEVYVVIRRRDAMIVEAYSTRRLAEIAINSTEFRDLETYKICKLAVNQRFFYDKSPREYNEDWLEVKSILKDSKHLPSF